MLACFNPLQNLTHLSLPYDSCTDSTLEASHPAAPSRYNETMPSNVPNRYVNRPFLRWLLVGVLLIAGAMGALWYNEHRAISWKDTLDPFYWWRRWHNEDLYLPQQDLLLHGNHQLPEVALTFDDGPHPQSLPSILATLQRFHVHATFFDVGENMAAYPNLVRETLAEGNEIGNHTSTHLRLPHLSPLERHHEINDADITFYRITGQHLYLLRPPGWTTTIGCLQRQNGWAISWWATPSAPKTSSPMSPYLLSCIERLTA